MSWIVSKTASLLDALKDLAPDSSTTTLRSWIAEDRILVDGKVIKRAGEWVYPSQKIELKKKKQFMREGIEILYEDRDLVVICKPAGILSVATDYSPVENAHAYLKKRSPQKKIYPVHRLDREVSGLLVFAYTEVAKKSLKKQFEEHSILREYVAIVEGLLTESEGTWQSYLQESESYYVKSVADSSQGDLATTHYQVLRKKNHVTALKILLETGRKNQIRVHCKEAGYPILGDTKYGATKEFRGRVALHARKLGFKHERQGRSMVFEQEPPIEFSPYLP